MLNLLQPLLNRLPVVSPGSRSLRRHLLAWLLLPQLVLWLAAAAVTYNVAVRYADRANDHGLYLSSRALARQVKPIDSGLFVDFPRAAKDIIEADPDDRVYYMVSSPPTMVSSQSFRSNVKPEVAAQISFEQALETSQLTAAQKVTLQTFRD